MIKSKFFEDLFETFKNDHLLFICLADEFLNYLKAAIINKKYLDANLFEEVQFW